MIQPEKKFPTLLSKYQHVNNNNLLNWRDKFQFYRIFAGNHNKNKNEGLYFRVVYNPLLGEYCLQVVSYYRLQRLPYHVNDYHPFFAYFDSDYSLLRLLYDSGHHFASYADLLPEVQKLTINYPWHSLLPGKPRFAKPLETQYFHLSDAILQGWWFQKGKPQFKLRSKFADPWHEKLFPVFGQRGNFRDEFCCPNCDQVNYFDTMNYKDDLFTVDVVCCEVKHIVTYDPFEMSISHQAPA